MPVYPFEGNSGQEYRFMLMPWANLTHLTGQAGIYIFAIGNVLQPIPVFIGEARRINDAVKGSETKRIAQDVYGAKFLYVHYSLEEGPRDAAYIDLVIRYKPDLNKGTA